MAKRQKGLFKAEIIEYAERMAGLGFTNIQIANVLRVSTRTLDRWKKKHPEFDVAMQRGGDIANEKVISSLFENALGGFKTGSRKKYSKGVLVEENETFAPPNTQAQIFWLKNKCSDSWRANSNVVNNTILNKIGEKNTVTFVGIEAETEEEAVKEEPVNGLDR